MKPARPAIAVVTPNILMGLGLKTILEKIIPAAEVEVFGAAETFAEAEPDRFFHFFVAAQLFTAHATLFRTLRGKAILLTDGRPRAAYAGMHHLNVYTSEERIVHDILRMHREGHRTEHSLPAIPRQEPSPLTAREAEVLTLIARGCINKQIAQHLHIGLTTVISHRRNIMAKLGMRSVAELAIYAASAGYAGSEHL